MKKIAVTLVALCASTAAFATANPFQLVNLARNGYLKAQGIPSHAALCRGQTPSVSASELVRAGYAAGRVSKEDAESSRYERAVATQLRGYCND